jgi:electron transfer flavoprotein alpha subunit
MNRDVVVVLESLDARAEAINHGLLAEGGRIASLLEGNLHAVVTEPSDCDNDAWAQTLRTALENFPFRLVLFAHTDRGGELAPILAQHFGSAAVTSCFDIRFRNGTLYYVRYVYGGQVEQEVFFAAPPEFISMDLESVEALEKCFAAAVPANMIRIRIPEAGCAKKTIRTIPPDFRTIDIRYAKRILDVGAGCDQPELIQMAEELSCLLEASIGTTRVVVDNGSIPKARMIGQTGKSSSPEFSLTIGVSGSPHHVTGIEKSGAIFSVNSDDSAPIFGVSDAGFVADLNKLLPKLIDRIKLYRDKGLT